MKQLTNIEIASIAKDFNLEFALVKAVNLVESAGAGFDPYTNKIKIQFEPGYFEKFTHKRILNGVEGQAKEWIAFGEAYAIHPDAAMMSTSWGLGQIMGANYKLAGYSSIQAMVNEFKIGEYYQLKGMLNFIKNQPGMYNALRSKDWARFARLYNGPNYKVNDYDNKLADAYSKSLLIKIS
jgi:hypothetical protein